MPKPSVKRPRTVPATLALSPKQLEQLEAWLQMQKLNKVVMNETRANPSGTFAIRMRDELLKERRMESTRTFNFDTYSKEPWHELNTRHNSSRVLTDTRTPSTSAPALK